jgi:hypothetical protein
VRGATRRLKDRKEGKGEKEGKWKWGVRGKEENRRGERYRARRG